MVITCLSIYPRLLGLVHGLKPTTIDPFNIGCSRTRGSIFVDASTQHNKLQPPATGVVETWPDSERIPREAVNSAEDSHQAGTCCLGRMRHVIRGEIIMQIYKAEVVFLRWMLIPRNWRISAASCGFCKCYTKGHHECNLSMMQFTVACFAAGNCTT